MNAPDNAIESSAFTAAVSIKDDSLTDAGQGLSLATKVLYGAGEIVNSIKALVFGLFVLFFYTSVLGLPGALVGTATALGLVWDAVADPLIGYLSDRARFRFGRRHTFMLAGALCMGLSFFALFSPPASLSTGALFGWLLVTSLLLRTTNSIFMIPYYALGAELSQDYHERTSITGIRGACALVGTLIAAVMSFAVFFPTSPSGVDPKFNPASYSSMGLVFGAALTLLALVTTVGTLSQRSHISATQQSPVDKPLSFLKGLTLAIRNPSFFVVAVSGALFYLASVINAAVAIYFLTYYVQITGSSALSLFQLVFYVGGVLGVAFWLRLAKRFDKRQLYFGATLTTAVVVAAAYWLVGEGRLFGTGYLLPLLIGNGLAGFFAGALWILPASMIADVTDQDELATGQRREGTFFGIFSFFQQVAASLAILAAGILVDRFAGLIPGQVEQSSVTIERLAVLFSLVPAALLVVASFLILGYRLDQERIRDIKRDIEQSRLRKSVDRTT